MRIFPLFALALSLQACQNDQPAPVDPPGNQEPPIPILPLGPGKSWSHRVIIYDTAGMMVSRDTVVTTITLDTLIQGERWFAGEPWAGAWLANRGDGLYSLPAATRMPILFLKHPAVRGEIYYGGASGEDTVSVLSTVSSVTVPKGIYTCVRYRFTPGIPTGLRASAESWYSPGIGEVWTIVYGRKAGGELYVRYDAVLIDFSL